MRKLFILMLAALLAVPALSMAQSLEMQIKELQEELEDISDRLDDTERHSSTDRITFTGDFRTKADTVHYQDMVWNPAVNVDFDDFFTKAGTGALGGFNAFAPGANPLADDPTFDTTAVPTALDNMFWNLFQNNPNLYFGLQNNMAAFMGGTSIGVGPFPLLKDRLPGFAPPKKDIDNDVLYTTRLRLNMKAKVASNVNFAGRLSMYKNWGDSTGVKTFDSWDSFTMDGTNGGNTSGDWLRVERAYFDWKNIGGTNTYLSVGRRPSTYGPPSQFRENEMRGGTPSGHLVHFNFDGITVGYKLSEITGIEGQTIRFCYGQGFESQYGNGELFGDIVTDDTHLGGLNFDILNDGTNFLQATFFGARDINDGFKGTMAFPSQLAAIFAPTMNQDIQKFPNFNFVTRVQPSTVIGDMMLGGLGFVREEMNGVNWFVSAGWTQTDGNGKAGMFGGLNSDAVFEAELNEDGSEIIFSQDRATEDEDRDAYGIYAGVQVPSPGGKFGLEYNFGSKYWTPFTQAQDDVIGSKLATRGHVGEAYYIFDVNPKMFIKVGGLYYDYEYTGSGSPVGAPQNVDEVLAGNSFSMLPTVDTAWDGYASLTVKF